MEQFQVNTKFLNSLPPEWSKFVTDVKLVKDLHTTNFDQLHAYLEQHELYANEVRLMRKRNQDPLALVVSQWDTPHFKHLSVFITTILYLDVPVFSPGDDPIGKQFLGRQGKYLVTDYKENDISSGGNNASGQTRVVKCYNYQGEGHMSRQCTQPKRPRNPTWYKDKAMLAEAQEAGHILDKEQLAFLADLEIPDDQVVQTQFILKTMSFSDWDLDVYDLNYFENNDLKAQLQDKDTTICKLKEIIKSMREKSKEENVNYDYCEIQTKNVDLENSVAKLLSENKRLCKEINHVKQVFKDQFDSIKKTRVRTKEQSDSLIDKLNLKSAENEDLKAQIQDKVFVITSLKNDLRKLKGKEIVDIVAQIPSANTIVPGMFKLDLEPLAPRLLQNREAHIDYLKYTQEQADILWGIVKQAKAK
ncbi:integrase, catalytic region, zinc finger, CCHC-type containing protein [Tanacetum coccineum]|uniref:Integrase, catalytic region, zinc finger, CCHC-type containing protein n=1 Tax=Tanacetum coccineum TaxID=301880 RepID=A0ABQ4Y993_9ASTR